MLLLLLLGQLPGGKQRRLPMPKWTLASMAGFWLIAAVSAFGAPDTERAFGQMAFDAKLMVVKSIELPEAKTRHFASVAKALELKKALVVVPAIEETLERSARNIPGITLATPDQLNVYTILAHPQLVLLEGAVEPLVERLK